MVISQRVDSSILQGPKRHPPTRFSSCSRWRPALGHGPVHADRSPASISTPEPRPSRDRPPAHVWRSRAELPPSRGRDRHSLTGFAPHLRDDDLERIALDLRRHWRPGEGPCGDMGGYLSASVSLSVSSSWERRSSTGCAAGRLSTTGRTFYSRATRCRLRVDRRMLAMKWRMQSCIGTSRRSKLKHDLKRIENQAFRLAGAFLLPSTTYPIEMRLLSLASMLKAKSVGA